MLADAITDWDTLTEALQLLHTVCSCGCVPTSTSKDASSHSTGNGGSSNSSSSNSSVNIHSHTYSHTHTEEITSADLERMSTAIERFKIYTVHLSDEALINLMSSLVASSLSFLMSSPQWSGSGGGGAGGNGGGGAGGKSSRGSSGDGSSSSGGGIVGAGGSGGSSYMSEAVATGAISFSLQFAVDVSKLNVFRISCVW